MVTLLGGLALLALLGGACAVLASACRLSAALWPLPLLAGGAVLLYGFGLAGALPVGAAVVWLALAAVCAAGVVRLRPAGFLRACRAAL